MKFLLRYWRYLRRMRLVHYLHNLRHYGKLKKNAPLYREAGAAKSVVASISHEDFEASQEGNIPWLDRHNALAELAAHPAFGDFDGATQAQLQKWVEQGYMVLEGFVDSDTVDTINAEVDNIIEKELLPFHYTNTRVMNCIKESEGVKQVAKDPRLRKLLDFAMGRKVKVFQTMNFLKGSKAKAHSDSIHMTTEPLGYLVAIWVALEDIHADSGPVFYCPGSHKMDYLMSDGFETGNTSLAVGDFYYENYTEKVGEIIRDKSMKPEPFIAKKGDVLVWHANLLHGGSEVRNEELTRKSLVVHYFCEGVICYHEITQRPAIVEDLE